MEKQGKFLAVENRRCFVNAAPKRLMSEKCLLKNVITTYRQKLIEEKSRETENKLRKKEQFIEVLDNAVVDIDKIAAVPIVTFGGKKGLCQKMEEEEEDQPVTSSKYQEGFNLDINMRNAFNKNFAIVSPEEKVKRLRKLGIHMEGEVLTKVRKEAEKIAEKLQLGYQSKVEGLLKATQGDLCNLLVLNGVGTTNETTEEFLESVKDGKEFEVRMALLKNPKLVHERDNV